MDSTQSGILPLNENFILILIGNTTQICIMKKEFIVKYMKKFQNMKEVANE
jgi:hypothetical protein